MIPSAGFFCKSLICFTMAFTVADERCSISSFLFYKGVLLFQTKSDFLEPTNTTTPLSVFAQEKRNARQAPSTKRRKRCVAVVRRERSFFRVSERCFFSLPFKEGGVNSNKVFFFFLLFLPTDKQTLNNFFCLFCPPLDMREKASVFYTSHASDAL